MSNRLYDANFSAGEALRFLSLHNTTILNILDNIPAGLAIFQRLQNGKFKVIAINQQLVNFGNTLHSYNSLGTNALSNFSWNRESLTKAFEHNIFAFAEEDDIPIVQQMLSEAERKQQTSCRFRLKGTSGTNPCWIEAKCLNKHLENGDQLDYILYTDVTEQVLWENELEHIGSHDSMTNVYNRYQYNKFLNRNKQNTFTKTGILFTDINGLKAINTTLGHATGDDLVKQTANILLKYFNQDCIYRISGDEFVVIVADIDESIFESNVNAMLTAISYYQIASVGHIWTAHTENIKELIFKAEQLMKIEKQKYYGQHITVASKHRSQTLDTLLKDLANKRYLIYLQPKADIKSNRIIGAEALIRKLDDLGNLILPYEFIPVLENEFLISRIDFFVLEEACKLIKNWITSGINPVKISVNMSRVTVAENDFICHVIEICAKYNVPHKYIEFEITESTTTKDNRKLYQTVSTLHDQQFGFSLDDMGSDYSSLTLLSLHGLDTVKLDRSMILKIKEPQGAILIKHIIAMCHELQQTCIAEGVEDEEQLQLLKEMQCDYYQGYLLDKPVPVDVFEAQYLPR